MARQRSSRPPKASGRKFRDPSNERRYQRFKGLGGVGGRSEYWRTLGRGERKDARQSSGRVPFFRNRRNETDYRNYRKNTTKKGQRPLAAPDWYDRFVRGSNPPSRNQRRATERRYNPEFKLREANRLLSYTGIRQPRRRRTQAKPKRRTVRRAAPGRAYGGSGGTSRRRS